MTLAFIRNALERERLVTTLTAEDAGDRVIAVAAQTRYRHWWVRADRGNPPWVIVKLAFRTIDAVRSGGSIFDFWFPVHSHVALLATERGCALLLFNLILFVEDHEGREFFEVGADAPFQPHQPSGRFKEEFLTWFLRRGILE